MGLEAGVVKRCSIDVVCASYRGVLEDEEAGHFHLVVVTSLHGSEMGEINQHLRGRNGRLQSICPLIHGQFHGFRPEKLWVD